MNLLPDTAPPYFSNIHSRRGLSGWGLSRRGVMLVIACCIASAAAAYSFAAARPSEYSASSQLLFRDPGLDQKLFGNAVFRPSIDPSREAETNLRLVDLQAVSDRVAKRLGGRLTGAEVSDKVQATALGRSDVVSITATDSGPRLAAELANSFATTYIDFRREADRSRIREAGDLVERQLATIGSGSQSRRRDLERRAEQLATLSSLQTGNAELVQTASVPTAPSGPRPARNALLGGFLGLLVGLALAYVLGRLDHTLRNSQEVEEIFGSPVLTTVPKTKILADAGGAVPIGAEAEAFRMLRANIRYFNVTREIRCVLVTSAHAQEGKTTVALNLARANAYSGARTLLIEADLRLPVLAARLDLRGAPGLSDLVSQDLSIEDVVQREAFASSNGAGRRVGRGATADVGARATIDVIVAGASPPNPAELLSSQAMQRFLAGLQQAYDFVVIDTAPLALVADSIPLIHEVDGVIVISRIGKSTRGQAQQFRDQLKRLDAPLLGVVVNGESVDTSMRYGSYAYHTSHERPSPSAV